MCVVEFPVGRAPSQLDITLTGGQEKNKKQTPQGVSAASAVLTGTRTDCQQQGFPTKLFSHPTPDSPRLVTSFGNVLKSI